MLPKIAVVEDEEALSVLLRYNLEAEGFEVDTILRGDEAEIRCRSACPTFSSSIGCCPGFPASSSAAGCASGRKRSACRSSC